MQVPNFYLSEYCAISSIKSFTSINRSNENKAAPSGKIFRNLQHTTSKEGSQPNRLMQPTAAIRC